MILPELSRHNKNEKLITLKRQRLIRKFWLSKKPDDIIFVQAPMLYGKTTMVLDAMRELNNPYAYMRFDSVSNNLPGFYGSLVKHAADGTEEKAKSFDPDYLDAEFKDLKAVIFDDFQLCTEQSVLNAFRSVYERYGRDTQFIIISRSSLPRELEIYKYNHKIRLVTESDLAFSETEIKKLAEQNKLWINTVHAKRLCEMSAGCAGFIAESLPHTNRFIKTAELPDGVKSFIDDAVSAHLSKDAVRVLADMSFLSGISKQLIEKIDVKKNIMRRLIKFTRETGLLEMKDDVLIPHKILIKYLKSNCPVKKSTKFDIYNKLISSKAYTEALDYALHSGDKKEIEDALCFFHTENIKIGDYQLERLYSFFNGEEAGKTAKPFLHLHKLKTGESMELYNLLELSNDYEGIRKNLDLHVFAVPYPHHITEAAGADKPLIRCWELFDTMNYSASFDLLNSLCGKYTGKQQYIYFCLLIDTLRNLHMYTAAENEMLAFENWAEKNTDFYELFELFRTGIYIIDGSVETAKEWLSQKSVSITARINRGNIRDRITDALAYIALGETDGAVWWLKSVLDFAERANIEKVCAECCALLSLAYRQKNQTGISVSYMEKALDSVIKHNCPSVICNLGKDVSYMVEHCYLKSKSKGHSNVEVKRILFYVKNKNHFGGFAVCRNGGITLSKRQIEILELLSEEYTYNQIAEKIGIKITTVRDHIKRLYEKLEVRNAEDAVVKAREKGIIKTP